MGRRAVEPTVHFCFFTPPHGPHHWSCFKNTPGKGEMLCPGWHGRPGEYSPEARTDDLPADRNYTNAWFDVSSAAAWSMFLPKRIDSALEIGSFEGRSANWLLSNRDVGHLTCVDPFETNTDPCSDLGGYAHRFDHNVMEPFGDRVTKVCGYSPNDVPDGEYNLIFIDGEHSYEQTIADLKRCWPLLKPGGLMIVDDIAFWPYDYGALRAVEKFFSGVDHERVFTGYQYGARKPAT